MRSQFVNTQIVFENRKNNCEINCFLTFPDLRAKNRPNEGARALWSEMRGVGPLTFLSKRGGPGFMRKFMSWQYLVKLVNLMEKTGFFRKNFRVRIRAGPPGPPFFKRVNLFSSLIYILISIHYFNYIFSEKNNYLI